MKKTLLKAMLVGLAGLPLPVLAHDASDKFIDFEDVRLKRSERAPDEVLFFAKRAVNVSGHTFSITGITSPQAKDAKLVNVANILGAKFRRDVKEVRMEPGTEVQFSPDEYMGVLEDIKPYEIDGVPYFDLEIGISNHAPMKATLGYPVLTSDSMPRGEDGVLMYTPPPAPQE